MKKIVLFGLLLFLPFICVNGDVSAVTVDSNNQRSLVGSNVINGVDYSGQGTVINNPINSDKKASVSGDYVNVPTYLGAYDTVGHNHISWLFKFKDDWSTTRQYNPDFTVYTGETTTQLREDSKTQYRYKQWDDKKTPIYATQYITEYKGSHWWNCLSFPTEKSFNGYPGSKKDHTITKRYTKTVVKEYKGGYNIDNKWRDDKPYRAPWEEPYEVHDKREVYRYEYKTVKWNKNSNPSTEQVPLNYSLFRDSDNMTLVWDKETKLTIQKERSFFESLLINNHHHEKNTDIISFYITNDVMLKYLLDEITNPTNGPTGLAYFLDLFDETDWIDYVPILGVLFDKNVSLKEIAGLPKGLVASFILALETNSLKGAKKQLAEYLEIITNCAVGTYDAAIVSFSTLSTDMVVPRYKIDINGFKGDYVSMKYDAEFFKGKIDYSFPIGSTNYGIVRYEDNNTCINTLNKYFSGNHSFFM